MIYQLRKHNTKYTCMFFTFLCIHIIYYSILVIAAYHAFVVSLIMTIVTIIANGFVLRIYIKRRDISKMTYKGEIEGDGTDQMSVPLAPQMNNGYNSSRNNAIYQWLCDIDLQDEYYHLFINHGIEDIRTISTLTKDDLIQIGVVKLGHRNKIMSKIQNESDQSIDGVMGDEGETNC